MQMYIRKLQRDAAALTEGMCQHLEQANLGSPWSADTILDMMRIAALAAHVDLDNSAMAHKVQAVVQQCAVAAITETDQLILRLRVSGYSLLQTSCNVSAAVAWLQGQQKEQSTADEQ
jgi:hypothetical protein